MNNLISVAPGIIADPTEFAKIETKSAARLLVLSDTHGIDFEALKAVVENFGPQCDALIFCGDGVFDICYLLKLAFADEKIAQKIPKVIAMVRGNNDASSYEIPRIENAKTDADYLQIKMQRTVSLTIANRNILITHGNENGISYLTERQLELAKNTNSSILFLGHTHIQDSYMLEKTLVVNPGSLSFPRNAQKQSFAVVCFPGMDSKFDVELYSLTKSILGYSFNCRKSLL